MTCETSGEQAALTAGIDLTAYRIVQEALTNALRHAPGATVSVLVGYAPAELTVEVTNSRPGAGVAAAAGAASRAGRDISAAGSWSPAGPGYGLAGHRRARRLLRRLPRARARRRRRLHRDGPPSANVT